jgi:hypothetical protein
MNYDDTPMKNNEGTENQAWQVKDYVTMQNGVMMVVRNGKKSMMDEDIFMTNGTVVKKTGTYTLKNGRKMVMQEGDKMDMGGNIIDDTKMSNPQPAF